MSKPKKEKSWCCKFCSAYGFIGKKELKRHYKINHAHQKIVKGEVINK